MNEDEMMVLTTRPCLYCGKDGAVSVKVSELRAYHNGAYIQNAMPSLSAALREQIISGTHPECFDRLFPADE